MVSTVSLVLLLEVGSVTPAGGDTVATLLSDPEAGAVPVTVKVMLPPTGSVGIATLFNVVNPMVTGHTAPPEAEQLILTPINVPGIASLMVAPLAAEVELAAFMTATV